MARRESEYIWPACEREEQLESKTESGHLAGGLDSLFLKKDRRPRGAEGLYVRFGARKGNQAGKSWRRSLRLVRRAEVHHARIRLRHLPQIPTRIKEGLI